jgi:hypothetical protein
MAEHDECTRTSLEDQTACDCPSDRHYRSCNRVRPKDFKSAPWQRDSVCENLAMGDCAASVDGYCIGGTWDGQCFG